MVCGEPAANMLAASVPTVKAVSLSLQMPQIEFALITQCVSLFKMANVTQLFTIK